MTNSLLTARHTPGSMTPAVIEQNKHDRFKIAISPGLGPRTVTNTRPPPTSLRSHPAGWARMDARRARPGSPPSQPCAHRPRSIGGEPNNKGTREGAVSIDIGKNVLTGGGQICSTRSRVIAPNANAYQCHIHGSSRDPPVPDTAVTRTACALNGPARKSANPSTSSSGRWDTGPCHGETRSVPERTATRPAHLGQRPIPPAGTSAFHPRPPYFQIFDAHTGQLRDVKTMSGGETFQAASLSRTCRDRHAACCLRRSSRSLCAGKNIEGGRVQGGQDV